MSPISGQFRLTSLNELFSDDESVADILGIGKTTGKAVREGRRNLPDAHLLHRLDRSRESADEHFQGLVDQRARRGCLTLILRGLQPVLNLPRRYGIAKTVLAQLSSTRTS